MKKKVKFFAMAALALLAMSACNNEIDEQTSVTKGKAVSFQMGLASTRTSTSTDHVTTFVKGDAVGIFAYERSADKTDGALVVTNSKYVLSEDGTSWAAADANNVVYADSKKEFNYYAYYPYQEGATSPSSVAMTVKLDQSTAAAADYNASDVLTARNKAVAMNTTTVALTFTHAFALVQVNLEGLMADKDATVTMQNVYPGASLNLLHADDASAAGGANGTESNVAMYSLPEVNQIAKANRFAFRAIVPAQSVAANEVLLEIQSKGKTYRFTYSTAVKYEASKLRVMNVSLGETSAKTTITIPASDMTVDKWGTTDAGTGTGSVEEAPVTSLTLTLPTDLSALAEYKSWGANTAATGDNDFWFKRIPTTGVAPTTISYDQTEKALALAINWDGSNNNSRGSWNSSNITFHSSSSFEPTTYSISFQVKSNTQLGNVGIGVSNSNDNKLFQICNTLWADWSRTVTTESLKTNTDWITLTLRFNFAKTFINGQSSNVTNWSNSTPEDVKGINILFYNYFNNTTTTTGGAAANTLFIKDIKIEKYVAPAP